MKTSVGLLVFLIIFGRLCWAATDLRDSEGAFGVLDFLPWDHAWNNHHYELAEVEKAADLMAEAGVSFVRIDFLWEDIEPVKGQFQFEKYDAIVGILEKKGIKILGVLGYNPLWAGRPWNSPPHTAEYVRYAERVVGHYKDKVKYWEIWNEPDHPNYWTPQDDMKSYTLLLQSVYPALKRVDPTCQVLLGSISTYHPIQLKRIYKNGGGDFFDVINIHLFADPRAQNGIQILRSMYRGIYKEIQRNHDTAKPIWITEIGCPGNNSAQAKGWWLGKSPTEEEQAKWVDKIYSESLRWEGVQKVFWAFFRDTPNHFKNGVDHFGLVRQDFSKKPAFEHYRSKSSAVSVKGEKKVAHILSAKSGSASG